MYFIVTDLDRFNVLYVLVYVALPLVYYECAYKGGRLKYFHFRFYCFSRAKVLRHLLRLKIPPVKGYDASLPGVSMFYIFCRNKSGFYLLQEGKEINIAVSSRALFELEEENDVFDKSGRKKYIEFQISREHIFLKPGSAFPFIQVRGY